MPKIRPIIKPSREGKNVTLSEARAAFRKVSAEAEIPMKGRYLKSVKDRSDGDLKKKIAEMNRERDKKVVKAWSRRSEIVPDMVGHTITVHNGAKFVAVHVSDEMVGHKLGEFALERTKEKPTAPLRSKLVTKLG